MKLDLYAVGSIDKETKRAGCGVIVECTHPDGRVQRRALGFRLGLVTSQFASLRAAQLSMLALRRLPPPGPVTLHVDRYVATMLERQAGRYKAAPTANAAAVADLRQTYERCLCPGVVVARPTTDLSECLELARAVAAAQTNQDSGTYLVSEASDERRPGAAQGATS